MRVLEKFLVDFRSFFDHCWTDFQVHSLSLCLLDVLITFSTPTVGHFWPFLDHLGINFCHFLTKINNFQSTLRPISLSSLITSRVQACMQTGRFEKRQA